MEITDTPPRPAAGTYRDWFASKLGVSRERKQDIYVHIFESATLRDLVYWLQVLAACGIATLGLVLDSPAVIIGAMLISPLMGPILAAGLALATGDVVLGLKAVANIVLSCCVAVAASALLVAVLPFREMTGEIVARTQPTTLDLVVALLSGAIGTVATCKEVKGVVTSIPGVAIAVALMPPLCVVGYGFGVALTVNLGEGTRVVRGGGLLFLTNLVAITFAAMVVFLALHVDTEEAKARIVEFRRGVTSAWYRDVIGRLPASDALRTIGGLPGRFLLGAGFLVLVYLPLGHAFGQLKREIAEQQRENLVRQAATEVWQQYFERLPTGEPHSYLDSLACSEQAEKVTLHLRVFTVRPYSAAERREFTRLVAARLNRPASAVGLQLVEIPTTSAHAAAPRPKEEPRVAEQPTVGQLQASLIDGVESALGGVRFPAPARPVGFRLLAGSAEPLHVAISYLGDRDMGEDAQSLVADEVRSRLDAPAAGVSFERIAASAGPIPFDRDRAGITPAGARVLDLLGQALGREPALRVDVTAHAEARERGGLAEERAKSVADYLVTRCQIAADRISATSGAGPGRTASCTVGIADEGSTSAVPSR